METKPSVSEQYKKGKDVINYVVYRSTTGHGSDEVLQYKILGITETSHITLHPDGTVNFRIKRSKTELERAVHNGLSGFSPSPSENVKNFIIKVRGKI
jgi:hypothetical protein